MSLVPSEIEYQHDSDPARETARISGLAVFVMLGLLACGFASVGYLALDEMMRGRSVLASAPTETQAGAQDSPEAFNDTPTIETESDENNASPEDDDSILNDAVEFSVAQTARGDEQPVPPSAPAIKPSSTPPPTVVYDPAVFDGAAAGPEVDALPPAPVADEEDPALDAPLDTQADEPADEPPHAPAPERQAIADPAEGAPSEDIGAPPQEEAAPPAAASVAEDPPAAEPPAQQPAAAAAAPIDALSGSHVVQLASYRSQAEAEADWLRIRSRLGEYLSGKAYQIESADLGERGVFHRLRIGPFASSDAAQSYCQGLKDRGQDCLALRR